MRIDRLSGVSFFALTLLATVSAHAASNNATATANVTANIASAITLTKTSDLSFGDFTADSAACTVTVNATGTVAVTGNCASITGSTPSAAAFTVGGSGSRSFTTNVSATSPTLSDGAGHTIPLTLQNNAPTHLTGGAATINVYGSLAVGANQVAGSYSDTVNVTVAY